MNSVVRTLGPFLIVAAVLCGSAAASTLTATGHAAAETTARVGVLSVSYPDRFGRLDLPHTVLVADYPLSRNSPTMQRGVFPAGGVFFELFREELKPQPSIPAPAGRFPLRLGSLGRILSRPNGHTWERRFSVQGGVYWVIAWLGKRSSTGDRATIASVVSSIHPY